MEIIYVIGRILFAALFMSSGVSHITKLKDMSAYAKSMGVPAPGFMTILTGLMILFGGLMVLFDFYLFYGALLLVIFLIPTAIIMHGFWKVTDPMMKQVQMSQFMKNIALAGAGLMMLYFTYGTH
jgi:DoxX.